jgi:hypothetical protein
VEVRGDDEADAARAVEQVFASASPVATPGDIVQQG